MAFVAQAVRATLPYLFAAMGGSLCERSGVIDLAIEAKLIAGAFCAAVFARATGSIAVGLVAGAAGGVLMAAAHAALSIRARADQVVVGVALNLAAASLARYLLQVLYGSAANSDACPALGGGVARDPLVWIAIIALVAVPWAVLRTTPGLRLRAAGDRPDALRAAGVSVGWTRAIAMLAGGALAGLGGAELSLAVGGYGDNMTGGRGYIALCAVILGGWRPLYGALAALAFGIAHALATRLDMYVAAIPSELTGQFPYVLALVVLAIAPLRARPPAALGRADD
jgi:simple sugar transport system permease protein